MFFQRNIIEIKLDNICNNPKSSLSSNPYDYTKDSQDYIDIVNSGEVALKYMLTKFENGKGKGLREYVMAIACSDILKEDAETKKWVTGRGWYANYIKENNSSYQRIDIFTAKGFNKEIKTPIQSITDKRTLTEISTILKESIKLHGVLDVAEPNYVLELNDFNSHMKSIYMWIDKDSIKSMYMYIDKTETGYLISEKNTLKLKRLLIER